jgi:DNA-binding CsgD family transcriptional regulator
MGVRRRSAAGSTEQTLLRLVDLVYDAALDPAQWRSCLEEVCTATHSAGAALTLHDHAGARRRNLWWAHVDPALIAEDEAWAAENPFILAGAPHLRTGFVCRSHEIIDARDVKRTPYFHEYLRRADFLEHIAACIVREQDVSSMLFLPRRVTDDPHDQRDVALVRALLPHLQRALAIHRRFAVLDGVSVALGEVLDRLPFGVVLLDGRGRSLLLNRAARDAVDASDGLTLARDGSVHAAGATHGRLSRLIADACATGRGDGVAAGGTLLVARPSGKRAFAVLVTPLRVSDRRFGEPHPVAALFVSDPDRDGADPHEILCRLYGFTPAESAVAWLLLAGKRVTDITDALAVTANTVRTHVKRLLTKTGCRTQADLVRVLLSGPATLIAPDR